MVEIASYVRPPPFFHRAVKFATEEGKNSSNEPIINEDDEKEVQALLEELTKLSSHSGVKPNSIAFEKDDKTNYHI